VVGTVVSGTILLVLIGLAIGVPLALTLSRYLQSLLFGLQPTDAWSLFAVVALMAFMAALASIIPARRAVRIDPVIALRSE